MGRRRGSLEGMGVSVAPLPRAEFWSSKRVLLTGHTGFKGGWTALWLAALKAHVTGFALRPEADPALFHLADISRDVKSTIGDIRDPDALQATVESADPQIVIHMAAQPLVRRSLLSPVDTFAINVQGTANLLQSLRGRPSLEAVLVVTSDKVYANDGRGSAFRESDPLGGKDPYSASKAAGELVVRSFLESYFGKAGVPLATARAGNIIGGGDFSEDRLVPDVVRAVRDGKQLVLRHPEATRPWQHVLDCVGGYLLFIEALVAGKQVPRSLNFGPAPADPVTVARLAEAVLAALRAPPVWTHEPMAHSVEMPSLTLDSTLARECLGWQDHLAGDAGVAWTAEWYLAFAQGDDVRALTLRQLATYRERVSGSA
jgi:CDP-glucose 4,6-dehydratase